MMIAKGLVFSCLVLFSFTTACLDIIDPGEPSKTIVDSIMPNAKGYFDGTNSNAGIQGGWYYYKTIGTKVTRFDATSFMNDVEPCIYNFGLPANAGPEDRCKDASRIAQAVDRVCITGEFGFDSALDDVESDKPEPYVGIGLEVCSSKGDNIDLRQFPYMLATCPLRGGGLLKKFVGISFKITGVDGDSQPNIGKLVVQFKEREYEGLENNAYCVVSGDAGADEVRCISNGESSEENLATTVYIGDVRKKQRERVNLSMVQAIHFEAYAIDTVAPFSFCIEELKAIMLENSENTMIGELIPIPTEEGDVTISSPNEEGGNILEWVETRDSDASASDTETYPDGGPFEISKKEVTVAQYYDYLDKTTEDKTKIFEKLRPWDSCNVYKYALLLDNALMEQAANCINWYEAKNFCRWAGGRLPTKTEWKYAARSGHPDYNYPWGDYNDGVPTCDNTSIYDFDKGGSGCGNGGQPAEPCEKPDGNTLTGVCDMLGNLWEWVDTDFAPKEGQEWATGYKIIMGGAFNTEWQFIEIDKSESVEHPVDPHSPTRVGIRCVRDIEEGK